MKALNNFIKKNPYFIWHTKDYAGLSEEAIVEAVLNYGDFSDFKKIVKILGIKKAADIFKKGVSQKRSNYRPEIENYFRFYFKKYAR